jgi:site-specific DNA-methyltransferase (adenine-specific)
MNNTLALTPTSNPPIMGGLAAAVKTERPIVTPWLDKVILGDCQKVLRQLPDNSVDMVLTDPPYLVGYRDRSGRTIANDDNGRWIFPAFAEMFRVMKADSYCVSFYGWSKLSRFLTAWNEIGFRPVGHFVWVKGYSSCARHTRMRHEQAYLLTKGNPPLPKDPPADVIEWTYTGNKLHPTQKPVRSLLPLIRAFTKPGDVIADPFAGSGTTGVAARHCNRRFILIEQDTSYHRAACERFHPLNVGIDSIGKREGDLNL